MFRKKLIRPIALAILILSFSAVALAGSSTTLLGYQIDYLGFVNNGNNTSTWTYAVTSTSAAPTQALSHWTLGVGACYDIVSPANGSQYTTPTTGFGCGSTYTCEPTTCTVVHGNDATTGVDGIKFEDCDPQLSKDPVRTHIFRFTVTGVPTNPGDVQVGVKPGNTTATGLITGPSCAPNAVSIASAGAVAEGNSGSLLAWAAAMLLAAAALWLWRKQSAL